MTFKGFPSKRALTNATSGVGYYTNLGGQFVLQQRKIVIYCPSNVAYIIILLKFAS